MLDNLSVVALFFWVLTEGQSVYGRSREIRGLKAQRDGLVLRNSCCPSRSIEFNVEEEIPKPVSKLFSKGQSCLRREK